LERFKTPKLTIKYHQPHQWKLSLQGMKHFTARYQDFEKAAQNTVTLPDRNLQLFFIYLQNGEYSLPRNPSGHRTLWQRLP
jgi:hypothetical protein